MYILSEKEMEDILVLHSELIEPGLTLLDRQMQLGKRRIDLLFKDASGKLLLVELKKDEIIPENVDQIDDYVRLFTHHQMLNQAKGLRPMLIGQSVPAPIRIL